MAMSRRATDAKLMRFLGVSREHDEVFSSATIFYHTRRHVEEKEPDTFFRTEIWNWMELSLSKGQYRSIAKNIQPVYDIHKLHSRVEELVNMASPISCIME